MPMNSTAVRIDWWSAEQRLQAKLVKAQKRRDEADFAVQQVEQEIERVKRARMAARDLELQMREGR